MHTSFANALSQLAPNGTLRAAINLSNFLLVSGRGPDGQWRGVAPDLARAVAQDLCVPVTFIPYDTPSQLAQAADKGGWTMALVGADPARAGMIAFTRAYSEIRAGYLVPPGSGLRDAAQVDSPGRRIAAFKGSAYGLWLERNLKHAELVDGATFDDAFARIQRGEADALASLMPKLLTDQRAWPGSRILPGSFMTVQQAIGTPAGNQDAAAYLDAFVARVLASGLVASLIDRHKAEGLTAAA